MALGTFIAGRYTATFNAVDIGISRTGFELEFQFKQEAIDETDAYGLTTIDMIHRGCDTLLNATLREYKAGSKAILWPIGGGTIGKIASVAKPIGTLASDNAAALVFTSVANTPAASSPATLTASKAWIAPNYNPRILFDSRLRDVPIRMIFLPADAVGEVTAFTTT